MNLLESYPKCSAGNWGLLACILVGYIHYSDIHDLSLTFFLLLTIFRVQDGKLVTSLDSSDQIWSTWSYVLLYSAAEGKIFP